MKKLLLIALSYLSFGQIACADELKANVENSQIVAGEPFDLTLSYDGTDNNIQPDLSVLQKDFQIYSTSTSMQTSFVNGVVNQRRDWTIGLLPLKEGSVQIPEIKAGNLKTKSIDLTVLPTGSKVISDKNEEAQAAADNKAKFATEFTIDEKNPYLKQEITGTLVIKDYIGLEFVSDPTFLNAEDWNIKILTQPEVKAIENGREITVNFAMFPLKSGELEVPSLSWQAVYYDLANSSNSRRSGFFDMSGFSMMHGIQKPLIIQTKPQKIEVKPIPTDYGNEWWLPAKALNLAGKWTEDNPQFKVGETASREVILSAAGVLDSELPELEFTAPENIKQYPEKPQYSLSVYKTNPIAQAAYRIVYIPLKSGELTLPEIKVKWFNVKTGKAETAVVAAQKIKVAQNPAYKEIETEPEETEPKQISAPETMEKVEKNQPQNDIPTAQNSYLWLALAFIFGMILSYLLFAKRGANENDGKTLNKIRKNLKNNDYRRLRDNLIKWGNENFPNFATANLNDLALLVGEESFAEQMQILNRILYVDAKETPNSEVIIQGLKNCLQQKKSASKEAEPLPKLYD